MPVDPHIQALLDQIAAAGGPSARDLGPEEARVAYRMMVLLDGEPEPVEEVVDRTISGPEGEIAVRLYRPAGAANGVLLWLHGGGWTIGDLETADIVCRRLANRAGVLVVSADYRLAPEHPFPAAVDDTWATLTWVHEHLGELGAGGQPIAVGGDSAGGNLAAVLALRAAREGGPALALQLLVYPVTDCTLTHPSMEENADGYLLTRDTMGWFVDNYLGADGDRKDPDASPLHAVDVTGAAPAFIITTELDPLRDEGEAYAQRLRDAGVAVELVRYDGVPHSFFALGAVTPKAAEAADSAAAALRWAFRT